MKIQVRDIVRTGLLAALAVAIQAMNLPQPFTGPAVNAILYTASIFVSPLSGALVGLITPWVGLLMGIVKLAPVVPVVMAGNVTLCLVSGYLKKINRYAAMILAAVLKYGVMTLGIKYVISTGVNVPAVAYTAFTITQLFTALGGAAAASVILLALERSKKQGSAA